MNHSLNMALSPSSSYWLDRFPAERGTVLISENRPFMHAEEAYDDQYGNTDSDDSGIGIVNVLRKFNCDFDGPILELGCGTGLASIGLCKAAPSPWLLITDSSTTFIDIAKRKMERNHVDLNRVRFAVLSDTDLDRLPKGSLSAIVLRSVVHHFLDVPGWIRAASPALRPGGMIVCEEPCSSGYLIMGVICESLAQNEANGLTPDQRAKARLMADTMKAYNRRDVDKSLWEDKHLFRPEEMSVWAESAGLHSTFVPNASFETFATDHHGHLPKTDFTDFFQSYLHYCMSFGAADAARLTEEAAPLCRYMVEACSGTREPYLMGLFVLQKAASPATT